MDKINFQDGTLVTPAKVNIEGTQYPIVEAEYSGNTPLSAFVLNKFQTNVETAIKEVSDTVVTETATITQDGLMSKEDKAKLDTLNTIVVTETGTDLDNYEEDGKKYYFDVEHAPLNRPAGTNGFLVVIKAGVFIKQFWFRGGTLDTNDHETYVRTKNTVNGTWSNWTKYLTSKDIIQKDGKATTDNVYSAITVKEMIANSNKIVELNVNNLLLNGWIEHLEGCCQIFKKGNIVNINLAFKNGTSAHFLTLPEGFRPSHLMLFPATNNNSDKGTYVSMGTGGEMMISEGFIGNLIFASFSYKV